MGKLVRIMVGLLVGAAVGGGLALLFVPRSGAETRQVLQDRLRAIQAEGQRAAEEQRLVLTERFTELKKPRSSEP